MRFVPPLMDLLRKITQGENDGHQNDKITRDIQRGNKRENGRYLRQA